MSVAARILVLLVRAYRYGVSPLLPAVCRFEPSCSRYAEEAVRTHGARRGAWMAAKRLARCRPGCEGGYDPVPPAAGGSTAPRAPSAPPPAPSSPAP